MTARCGIGEGDANDENRDEKKPDETALGFNAFVAACTNVETGFDVPDVYTHRATSASM